MNLAPVRNISHIPFLNILLFSSELISFPVYAGNIIKHFRAQTFYLQNFWYFSHNIVIMGL